MASTLNCISAIVRVSTLPIEAGYKINLSFIHGSRKLLGECVNVTKHRSEAKEIEMDWRVFLTTFGVIFLAEMGDKTQLAAMSMAAQTKKPWAVFIAAALALTAVSAIGVLVGSVLGNYLPLLWIKRVAAVAFIVIGVLILTGKF
jgi:putative Ca2+/H+ antiporter (TMEM165/GDT1 family)